MPKATCLSSPKLPQLGNLGTRGEGPEMSTPACPIKGSASTKHDMLFYKHTCSYPDYYLIYYVMHTAYKYRLNHKN